MVKNTSTKPKIVVILGPTASGKTGWGIELAQEYNGEVISADSRQIFKNMDIGTAKPEELKRQPAKMEIKKLEYTTQDNTRFTLPVYSIDSVPHYLFDVVNPDEEFTVAHFKEIAEFLITTIHANSNRPFIVGGTGLYISALVDNLYIPHSPPDKHFREEREEQLAKNEVTVEELYNELLNQDPHAVEFIEPHNSRRIIRALEVIKSTGKKLSDLRKKGERKYDIKQIGIDIDSKKLEQHIDMRVDDMVANGLIEEVTNLYKTYKDRNEILPALTGIGYREIIQYLEQKISLEDSIDLIKIHTKQFTKRQMKWFRRDKTILWTDSITEAQTAIKHFLE